MEESPVHIRLWDRRAEGLGFWVHAYESLEPPRYRMMWPVLEADTIRLASGTITYRHLTINTETKRAEIFHSTQPVPVDYMEALQVLHEIENI